MNERRRGDGDRAGPGAGARTVFGPRQRWALLAAFALLVALRLPAAWAHGRFQDEEATVFLAYAWHRPWLDALFRPFAGYWNAAAAAATVAAAALVKHGIVPLEYAPYLTMTAALAAQLLPAALILAGRAAWLTGRTAVVAALLVVALAPMSEEVFLNVLHIQFHLALCAGLVLALDVPTTRVGRIGHGASLVAAPLCGPAAMILIPLFALRALIDRDRGRRAQLAALAAGTALQLALFYRASPMRGHLYDPATVAAAMSVRLIALPMLNAGVATRVGEAIEASLAAGGGGWRWSTVVAVVALGALVVAAARRRDAAIWLVLAALSIAAVSFGFGMVIVQRASLFNPADGERYHFLPLVLLGLALVALAMRRTRAWPIYAGLCALMLAGGAIRYPSPHPDLADGPPWPAEVAAWRRDHRHPLAVWPRPWTADLSDRDRACGAARAAPRYCEGGWAAGIEAVSRPGSARRGDALPPAR